MKQFIPSVVAVTLLLCSTHLFAQKDLAFYIEQAKANSPLIQDNKNQSEAARLEIDRLKAFYTKAQISLSGNYQFSPIISRDNGKSELVLNPTEAVNYTGYDIAASNGGVYQGLLNFNQPLFNESRFRANAEQTMIGAQLNENTVQLTGHDLEKFITDQYILCLQDYKQIQFLDDLTKIVNSQKEIVLKLVENGIAKQSDLSLITIEQKIQQVALNSFQSTYRRDLMDLRVLCGVADTSYQVLAEVDLLLGEEVTVSKFAERFRLDSLNLALTQKVFELKYKPLVGVYANTGLNAVYAPTLANRFGVSAGINFSMTLTDGKQRNLSQQRTSVLMKSTQAYRNFFYNQNNLRKSKILAELKSITERLVMIDDQLKEYQNLFRFYRLEVSRGQLSVINYVTILKSYISTQRDFVLLQSNKQQLINLYNYWNW